MNSSIGHNNSDKQDILSRISIASPCTVSWDSMAGDERVRFCSGCKLSVYNLSAMSSDEAIELMQSHEGNPPCIRFFRRADGTIITADCPIYAKRLERLHKFWRKVAAALLGLFAFTSPVRACENEAPTPSRLKRSKQLEMLVSPVVPPVATEQERQRNEREFLGVPVDLNLRSYMNNLQKQIKKHLHKRKRLGGSKCMVHFKIHKDGSLSDLRLMKPSDSHTFDDAALEAIRKASPFNALPQLTK